jgi:hypothetical protein
MDFLVKRWTFEYQVGSVDLKVCLSVFTQLVTRGLFGVNSRRPLPLPRSLPHELGRRGAFSVGRLTPHTSSYAASYPSKKPAMF